MKILIKPLRCYISNKRAWDDWFESACIYISVRIEQYIYISSHVIDTRTDCRLVKVFFYI